MHVNEFMSTLSIIVALETKDRCISGAEIRVKCHVH